MAEWDYIVVGAGSAGCVVANRLSAPGGGSVLLLEAGGGDGDLRFHIPVAGLTMRNHPKASWQYESEPEPGLDGRRVLVPRGRVIGGSSAINGTVYNRGNRDDFGEWAKQGLLEWDYPSVLPYFRRIESHWRGGDELHGGSGPIPVNPLPVRSPITPLALAAAKEAGYATSDDWVGREPEGWGVPDFNVDRRGRRVSAATAFLKPIASRKTLTIERDAQVLRIVFEGKRAVGIEYLQRGERRIARAGKEIILSAGVIGSPHILLLSGIGAADELKAIGVHPFHDLQGVGRNFNDQPAAFTLARSKRPIAFERTLRLDHFAVSAARWAFGLPSALSGPPIIAAANIRTVQGRSTPDMRLMLTAGTPDGRLWFPGIMKGDGHILMGMAALAHPKSRGAISLASSDPLRHPRILYNLLTDPADVEDLRRGYRLLREFLAQPALRDAVGEFMMPRTEPRTDSEIDAYLRQATGTPAHPMGSCRMGLDDEAVVDSHCRVRGLENLRVVDLSVFPSQISGNPNGPAMMLGDRASDMILGKTLLPRSTALAA